jgi:uncharacterized membrane protein YdfJ with MMPL/SSD domain
VEAEVVMSGRAVWGAVVALGCAICCAVVLAPATARAAECAKSAAGAPMATGKGNVNAKAETAGKARLGAERAAFLDALTELRKCLGDKASTVTGWTVAEVRYFDSDPVVEVDVAASFDPAPQVTVLGSSIPDVEKVQAAGGNIASARLTTTRSAEAVAKRNAQEALGAVFPETGAAGAARQELAGMLGGCVRADLTYWDDQAVTVKLTCGKGVESKDVSAHPAPALEHHKK